MKSLLMATLLSMQVAAAAAQTALPDSTQSSHADTTNISIEGTLDVITISSTRSRRSIQDIPTRVEAITGEELEEKANMKPGDIRMMLSESTGIQTQQTSATSANASIRIQGLDGRYTQILKDGFPLYAGAASGLGLLQTPPLDLKQVEIIKGSASTLYGGGAIAGLVNLISKTPGAQREIKLIVNGTSALGLDLSGFYSQRKGKLGATFLASRNSSAPYDPAGIDITAIPKFERYTVNPKLFWYPAARTTIVAGINGTTETREGGDLHYIRGEKDTAGGYYELNKTQRTSAQLSATHQASTQTAISLKASYGYFHRTIETPGYLFEGNQHTTYAELNCSHDGSKTDWVIGSTLLADAFHETHHSTLELRDYTQTTIGAFAQSTWQATKRLGVETGLRLDHVFRYGTVLLPRVALQYRFSSRLSSRAGGGLGYKTPTPFTEESERIQYRNVGPVSPLTNTLERSYGLNADANYRTSIARGNIGISVNQLFFYTRIRRPLLLRADPFGAGYIFQNADGFTDSRGGETNIRLSYGNFRLYLGYTFTDAHLHNAGTLAPLPLTPKHRVNNVLVFEQEDKWKLGLEAYYYSPQQLGDGATGREYWLCGAMAERLWARFSLYINFENFLDARQTRFDTIYTGTRADPQFRDIYAPLDGFVVNGGIKLRL